MKTETTQLEKKIMAGRGPLWLQPLPVAPAVVPPAPPVQLPSPPAQQIQPQMLQLNWSHFKPEYSGKPEEDAEAHLLRTNDWMETHAFPEVVKVQRFCLTLVGEVRLWYESLRLIAGDWNGVQDQFWQQFSKIGNTWQQLLHAWRSFYYDEYTETLDTYIRKIPFQKLIFSKEMYRNKCDHLIFSSADKLSCAIPITLLSLLFLLLYVS